MSHLSEVLRRSIAHLDPSDREGRELAFARARESMIRLLSAYDPPLTAAQIESKIDEFDAARRALAAEVDAIALRQRPELRSAAGAQSAGLATRPRTAEPPAAPPPARPAVREPTRAVPPAPVPPPTAEAPLPPPAAPDPEDAEPEPLQWEDEEPLPEDYPEEAYDPEAPYDPEAYEPEEYDPEAYEDEAPFEEEEDEPGRAGLGLRRLLLALFALLLLLGLVIGGLYLYQRMGAEAHVAEATAPAEPEPTITSDLSTAAPEAADPAPAAAPAEAVPAMPTEAPAATSPELATPAPSLPADPNPPAELAANPPAPAIATDEAPEPPVAGPPALETLVLFDGHDPSAFQSAPDNPVRFEGDTDGGFAEIASSSGSNGARLLIGPGVYERIAGRTIRIVVSARGARDMPATTMRVAYQNGRSISPWSDLKLGASYQPLAVTWSVPKERGGPERDALILEPGIPGDGTAADIRSVRIEILS